MNSARTGLRSIVNTSALLSIGALLLLALLAFSGPVAAQDDLSDPETCLMCHADMERDTTDARVHNPDGTVIQESHQMFACIDCHDNITEIPHPDGTKAQVDCLNCHEAVPEIN